MRGKRGWIGWVIIIVILGFVGIREYTLRVKSEIRIENQYRRAFQEMIYHVDSLSMQLEKAAVSASPSQTQKALADAWRHTESARSGLGQLPVGVIQLPSTETFLFQVASFTFALSQKQTSGAQISDDEWIILKDLQAQAKYAAAELAGIGGSITSERLRWTDVQRDIMTTSAVHPRNEKTRVTPSNQVTKSLEMLEDGMTRFPTPDFEGVIPPLKRKLPGIVDPEISKDEAIRIALRFVGYEGKQNVTGRIASVIPSEPECYRVEMASPKVPVSRAWADVSIRGGKVLWMFKDSSVKSEAITPDTAVTVAKEFLSSRGFRNMQEVSRHTYEGITTIGFAYEQDGTLIYPDYVVVRVSLDNGCVDGFEGTGYQIFHRTRLLKEPKLSRIQARKRLNPRLTVIDSGLAIILDDFHKERSVYEFRCVLGEDTYLVYIDADTGSEVEIKKAETTGSELDGAPSRT
ncbi:MAG: germination protein YpeB [Firmicutes bacterium]|nr:germination protein YpeB [Bacillota bacterium]